eukprot:scaffold222399_cov29-Tisochrysis_lutea.AAC.3
MPLSSGTDDVGVRFKPSSEVRLDSPPPRPAVERTERMLELGVVPVAVPPNPRPPFLPPVPLPPPLPLRGGGTSGGIHAKLPRSTPAGEESFVSLDSAACRGAELPSSLIDFWPAFLSSLFLRKRLMRVREIRKLSDWMIIKGRKTSGKRSCVSKASAVRTRGAASELPKPTYAVKVATATNTGCATRSVEKKAAMNL